MKACAFKEPLLHYIVGVMSVEFENVEELRSTLKITDIFYNLSQLLIKEVEKKKKVVLLDT